MLLQPLTEAWRRSTRRGRWTFGLAAAVALAQPFFVADYANDKTASVEQLVRSYSVNGGIAGREIPCIRADGSSSMKPTWAEEFPVFHYVGVGLARVLPGRVWERWLPALFHFGCIGLLFGIVAAALPELDPLETAGLYALTPIVVIHTVKLIPDAGTLFFALLGVRLALSSRRFAALASFFLAGLMKPLALALIGPLALGTVFWGDGTPRARWTKGIAIGAAAAVGAIAWMALLRHFDIDNPLLRDSAYLSSAAPPAHAPLTGFSVAYWSRYFTWIASRGLSWPLFALAIGGVAIAFRSGASRNLRIAAAMALFSPVYWFVVKGPQYTGPWYSLYVMPALLVMAALAQSRIRSGAVKWAILAALVASSVPKVSWSLDAARAYLAPFGTAFSGLATGLDCDITPIIRGVL